MNITARITGIKYIPFLCKKLNTFNLEFLSAALAKESTFILKTNGQNKIAISWWVSAKRTRSYPYSRVYDSLNFIGKKVTIIPIFKDEGIEGDRDFLQWDTISLMSLLDVHVIIAYYTDASLNSRYEKKITNQRFDTAYINKKIQELTAYKSSALHWNLSQAREVWETAKKAFDAYAKISKKLGVEMHSSKSATKRLSKLERDFKSFSRDLAKKAQSRETLTRHLAENVDGTKASITITNYLGGAYYFTADEVKIEKNEIYLVEAKNTEGENLPALADIKDGLLKMVLFSNLSEIKIDGKAYTPAPVLKLTMAGKGEIEALNDPDKRTLRLLMKEAKTNKFKLLLNESFLTESNFI